MEFRPRFAHHGLSYMAYTEQITFLLFLKMAHEQTQPPYNRPSIVPVTLGWESLLKSEGEQLEIHYRHILEELGRKPGMLGEIFKKARPDIQNPATLRRLIVDLIEPVRWSSMEADVKGDIYEGLLSRSAEESPEGRRPILHPPATHQGYCRLCPANPGRYLLRPGSRNGRLPARGPSLCHGKTRQPTRQTAKERPPNEIRQRLGTGPEHGSPLHHESVSARHRRGTMPDTFRGR